MHRILEKSITDVVPAHTSMLKTSKKEKPFTTIEKIKEKSKQKLLAIPKSAFQMSCDNWKKRWHKCAIYQGGDFEGDNIVIDK